MNEKHLELVSLIKKGAVISIGVIAIIFLVKFVSGSFFYAEPGYIYHVRTVTGAEVVVVEPGYKFYPFGRYDSWKRAMTVQASDNRNNGEDGGGTSADLNPLSIMFLDQVDALAEATVRFSIPSDTQSFLKMAHEYRTPENLLRTALIPSFKETLQANASLMSAEDYYSGGRNQFNSEFDQQMTKGVFMVKREEVTKMSTRVAQASANAAKGTNQDAYGDGDKTVFVVRKILDKNGQPKRTEQQFLQYGIVVVSALVTDIQPNQKFRDRMQLKQQASADRAIAREQRVQEEEQKLLAEAKGERQVAERQAEAKVEQIQLTTEAQTEKQLALTKANKLKESAAIEKETAQIKLEQAVIDAKRIKELADAEAYKKKAVLLADNALAQKLQAEIEIQGYWADAFAKRRVPTNVFGSGGSMSSGSDSETQAFMQLITLDAAKRLSYDRTVEK